MLIEEQVKLNDPGASLYLLNALAQDGWDATLRFYEGEIYRLRAGPGDAALAAQAYAAAVQFPDALPEGSRPRLCADEGGQDGRGQARTGALSGVASGCTDAAMVRFSLTVKKDNTCVQSWFCSSRAVTAHGLCAGYTLVAPQVAVSKGTMKVKPTTWNKAPGGGYTIPQEETWTQNGPVLDSVTFVGGVKNGEAIAKQRPKDDRQCPCSAPT